MPSISPLRFAVGDTVIVQSAGGNQMLTIVRSKRDGYIVRSNDGSDDRTWLHDDIYATYLDGNLEHYPTNLAAMNQRLAEVIQSDWDSWRPILRFEAECRLAYCAYVDRLRSRGAKAAVARRRAARTIFRRNQGLWTIRANYLAGRSDEKNQSARHARDCLSDPRPVVVSQPSEFTVRDWHRAWVAAGRDVRALIPRYHDRGHRAPRKTCKLHLQEHDDRPLCIYGAMRFIARKLYMRTPQPPRTYGYIELCKLVKEIGAENISYQGFCDFLNKHFTEYEEYKTRYGARKAYFKYGLFKRREAPDVPLEEVEVDHTLLDIFVRDANGQIGRPWLTILICRATRCIVGLHISFDVPSYATLGRAVLHALCPKDLSGFPHMQNEWPCHGVPGAIITDRGLEFLSDSFRRAGELIGFGVVNLPGRCPHLKGVVERFFGTLNIRVLARLDGMALYRSDNYCPEKNVRFSLSELTEMIVEWVVDDYHQTWHPTLNKAPIERWREQVQKYKVQPIKSFRQLITLLGETVDRKIGNTGIQWEGHTYASPELAELRKRRGGLQKDWAIRIDPYDRGEVWVHDPDRRLWIAVPAVHQKTARGVTKFQSKLHMRIARRMVPLGNDVTDAHVEVAMEYCAREARRSKGRRQTQRYFATGALATQVHGNVGLEVIADSVDVTQPANLNSIETTPTSALPDNQPQNAAPAAWDALLAARLDRASA